MGNNPIDVLEKKRILSRNDIVALRLYRQDWIFSVNNGGVKAHASDQVLAQYGDVARNGIRNVCSGNMPKYFRDVLWFSQLRYDLTYRLEQVEAEIETYADKYLESYEELVVLSNEKISLNYQIGLLADNVEPDFNIFARGQVRLALIGLFRYFEKKK